MLVHLEGLVSIVLSDTQRRPISIPINSITTSTNCLCHPKTTEGSNLASTIYHSIMQQQCELNNIYVQQKCQSHHLHHDYHLFVLIKERQDNDQTQHYRYRSLSIMQQNCESNNLYVQQKCQRVADTSQNHKLSLSYHMAVSILGFKSKGLRSDAMYSGPVQKLRAKSYTFSQKTINI